MSESEVFPVPPPPDDDHRKRELDLREREVAAHEREMAAKEAEINKSPWLNPLVIGLLASALAELKLRRGRRCGENAWRPHSDSPPPCSLLRLVIAVAVERID
jgi:hypothetical protein